MISIKRCVDLRSSWASTLHPTSAIPLPRQPASDPHWLLRCSPNMTHSTRSQPSCAHSERCRYARTAGDTALRPRLRQEQMQRQHQQQTAALQDHAAALTAQLAAAHDRHAALALECSELRAHRAAQDAALRDAQRAKAKLQGMVHSEMSSTIVCVCVFPFPCHNPRQSASTKSRQTMKPARAACARCSTTALPWSSAQHGAAVPRRHQKPKKLPTSLTSHALRRSATH